VVVTNPPFGGIEEPGVEQNFPQSARTRETADLFLVLIMRLLKPGGRAGIVLPDGTLFGEGAKSRIKEQLLQECNLHTIVRLPNSVFAPYTSIATNLLFFTKGEPTKEVWYYEHRLPQGVKAYNKTKPIRAAEFDLERGWWVDRTESEVAWKVSIDEIRARGFDLDIKNPHAEALKELTPEELLLSYREQQGLVNSLLDDLKEKLIKALAQHEI
jgi:type I restriction enzyme M protein